MSYPSVDALQKALGTQFFGNRQDIKKAAGRAMGTVVELISFYLLREWGLRRNLTIERGLTEFGNDRIAHNVEFGLHPIKQLIQAKMDFQLPISASKMRKALAAGPTEQIGMIKAFDESHWKGNQLLASDFRLRNACTVAEKGDEALIANLDKVDGNIVDVEFARLRLQPFAMIECKRVGVEDGARKGPTTIEKAKQGAYVARSVSALQKVRGRDGKQYGVMPQADGKFEVRELAEELARLVHHAPKSELEGFILTIGIVSNHGNWFTKDDPNKELAVLRQSYDWLLFLQDRGIVEFVQDTILQPNSKLRSIKEAFAASYSSGKAGKNRFTKVRIDYEAHLSLCEYFTANIDAIEKNWLSVLSPGTGTLEVLREELSALNTRLSE